VIPITLAALSAKFILIILTQIACCHARAPHGGYPPEDFGGLLERLDVGLLAKLGHPFFLQVLPFVLK